MKPALPEVGFGSASEDGAEVDVELDALELDDETDDDEDFPADEDLIDALGFDPDELDEDVEEASEEKSEEPRADSKKLDSILDKLKSITG